MLLMTITCVGKRENIPRDILKLPNIASKLFSNDEEPSQNQHGNQAELSPAASSIINIAAEHQQNASSSHLSKLVQNKGLAKINAM